MPRTSHNHQHSHRIKSDPRSPNNHLVTWPAHTTTHHTASPKPRSKPDNLDAYATRPHAKQTAGNRTPLQQRTRVHTSTAQPGTPPLLRPPSGSYTHARCVHTFASESMHCNNLSSHTLSSECHPEAAPLWLQPRSCRPAEGVCDSGCKDRPGRLPCEPGLHQHISAHQIDDT